MKAFVESQKCRHLQICAHFGEKAKWTSCGACDICDTVPAWLALSSEGKRKKARAAGAGSSSGRGAAASSGLGFSAVPTPPYADEELREYLREWRRVKARKQRIPAYIVMHDTSLDELCRVKPASLTEIRQVSGFGERKTELYGEEILNALARFRKRRAEPLKI
jgi:superfamily II DNA helicase RecQ